MIRVLLLTLPPLVQTSPLFFSGTAFPLNKSEKILWKIDSSETGPSMKKVL